MCWVQCQTIMQTCADKQASISHSASETSHNHTHTHTHSLSLSHTDTHLIKRQSIGQLQTQHDHAGDPEEEDVMTCLHQRQWVEPAQLPALHKVQCFMSSNTQNWPNSPPCIKFNASCHQTLKTGPTPHPA